MKQRSSYKQKFRDYLTVRFNRSSPEFIERIVQAYFEKLVKKRQMILIQGGKTNG